MSDNPEETAYYLRLVSMYMDICTQSVRKVFNFYSPNNNGEDFIRLNQARLNELKTKGILNQQECEVVITQWPNISRMDISLLITLSINLFTTMQLPPPTKGWDRPPKGKDISIAADLLRLRKIRNVIVGHHHCAQLPQWEFEKEWETIETILLRIEKQIDPGNEVHLQYKIKCYSLQQLQPCIQNEHDSKLKEWYQEVSKAQKQVDEYLKNLEGFNVYLKDKSDRYERYIKLLVKGGRFVLSALIKSKCQQSDLRCKLDENEDVLREKITDSEHLEILYPSASDRFATTLDLSVWDISLLTGVLLYAFECNDDLKEAIDNLYNARKNYAEVAVKSLDPDTFVDYLSDLKYTINVAKKNLNSEEKSHINEILEESKKKAKDDGSFKTYMEELKSQGLQMKTFSDIHKETIRKTKETLQQMITHGISFDSNRVLELKMITVGSDEEKKKIAENILFEVWQIALDRTENKGDFQEVQEEVNKILKEIKSKNIQNISVEQKCILLQIASREPCDMLALIEYFQSDLFHKTLNDICKAVGYHCDTIVAMCSNVTIESLHGILNEQHVQTQQESGIRVPITVSSPAAMMELWKLFQSEQFSNSTNAIAEKLSKHSNTPVTLQTYTDMKEFNDVFHRETEQSSTDSESNDSLTQDSCRTSDTELDFPYKGEVTGHPADHSSQYDKQKRLSNIESKVAKLEATPDDHQKHSDYIKQKKGNYKCIQNKLTAYAFCYCLVLIFH
ncbi:E3 ubiquitin-protein ligase DZIP3-like [Mercenaria mercenaria]|uniref:E3 ubiquitin-protein ligase DZIP3-like n=1 Tax=Mercenaria mercenaria TaxID=6596 RepID=UPI00234FA18A|nr:E3 ubiquitin-protein ligase DZIP3-like [Mercenaria mercenaria]